LSNPQYAKLISNIINSFELIPKRQKIIANIDLEDEEDNKIALKIMNKKKLKF
jgi:hypothetical protein